MKVAFLTTSQLHQLTVLPASTTQHWLTAVESILTRLQMLQDFKALRSGWDIMQYHISASPTRVPPFIIKWQVIVSWLPSSIHYDISYLCNVKYRPSFQCNLDALTAGHPIGCFLCWEAEGTGYCKMGGPWVLLQRSISSSWPLHASIMVFLPFGLRRRTSVHRETGEFLPPVETVGLGFKCSGAQARANIET